MKVFDCRTVRDTSTDSGSSSRVRLNRKRASDEPQAFLHTHQAQAALGLDGREMEAGPGIGDAEIDLVVPARQFDLRVHGAAMFHHVAQSFLCDPKKAQSHVLPELGRDVAMNKANLDAVLF